MPNRKATKLYFKYGGAVSNREAYVWVERPSEKSHVERILGHHHGKHIYSLRAHRQMGKSTFLQRLESDAISKKWVVVRTELTDPHFSGAADNAKFANAIATKMLSSVFPGLAFEDWREENAANLTPRELLCKAGQSALSAAGNLMILIDEFEAIYRKHDFWNLLLTAMQSIDPAQQEHKIVWVFAGIHLVAELIGSDQGGRSKYSGIESISLGDFDLSDEIVEQLVVGVRGTRDAASAVCKEVLAYTGGQPLLTSLVLGKFAETSKPLRRRDLLPFMRSSTIMADEHFEYPAEALALTPDLAPYALEAYRQIRDGSPASEVRQLNFYPSANDTRLCLLRSGLVREDNGELKVRSKIYHDRFDDVWIDQTRTASLRALTSETTVQPHRSTELRRGAPKIIAVINAGGTMGMTLQDGKVKSPADRKFWYLDAGQAGLDYMIEDLNPAFPPLDSVNVGPLEWTKLAKAISKVNAEVPDQLEPTGTQGIILVTGTDTLAYVASALSFALGRSLKRPLVITGSQAPHGVPHGDALANFGRSAVVIDSFADKLREVVVAFSDEVYRGVRVEKRNDFRYTGFLTPNDQPLAIITEKPRLNAVASLLPSLEHVRTAIRSVRTTAKISEEQANWLQDPFHHLLTNPVTSFDDRVLRLSLYPGLRDDMARKIIEGTQPTGVVLECLGLGNIPNNPDYDLLDLIVACREKYKIPVLITGRFPVDPEFVGQYDAADGPLREGAIASGNMTPAAALTKLMWGLSALEQAFPAGVDFENKVAWLRGLFAISWVGEHDEQRT